MSTDQTTPYPPLDRARPRSSNDDRPGDPQLPADGQAPDRQLGDRRPSDLLEAVERAGELLQRIPGKLARLHIENGAASIEMEWQPAPVPGAALAAAAAAAAPGGGSGIPDAVAVQPDSPDVAEHAHAGECVRSPLVGTFYRCPEPGAAPFVAEGDSVEAGDVVGIVEAMKLMNNITAPVSGRVVHIGVEDAQSVEYDQVLVVIVPDDGGE